MTVSHEKSLFSFHSDRLQNYYTSLESRIGYRILLGGTRHFGYYKKDTYWPFPINKALRRMEKQLFESLNLGRGSKVLDAGCGVGHVAINMAQEGLRVQGIEIIDHHLKKAKRNIKTACLEDSITIYKGDYHHLDFIPDKDLDGIYTMESFVHAANPKAALAEFSRVLRPGGLVVLYEYDYENPEIAQSDLRDSLETINKYASMPANQRRGFLTDLLRETGFQITKTENLSAHIIPMLRLFFLLAFIPYWFIILFGLQKRFINIIAGVQSYRGKEMWRYIAITARKPFNSD